MDMNIENIININGKEGNMRNTNEVRDYIENEAIDVMAEVASATPNEETRKLASMFCAGVLFGTELALTAVDGEELLKGEELGIPMIRTIVETIKAINIVDAVNQYK